jgi:hypothetical protein
MRAPALVVLTALTGIVSAGVHAAAAGPLVQGAADAQRKEYADLLVTLGEEALRQPRLASPLPCLAHWLAGSDRVLVAVSVDGAAAGLERGDTLRRIGSRDLTGSGAAWDTAMRALRREQPTYAVVVDRRGQSLRRTLPCATDRAAALRNADVAMWTAVTRREWAACVERGAEMLAAFGSAISPPLMVMTQCATAAGTPDAKLTAALAGALLTEMVAQPRPQPDLRQQLLLALRQLDALHAAGGEDFATPLRAEMAALGVAPEGR